MSKECPKCKSNNIGYNSNGDVWYCNDCGAIWYEYNQDLGGITPNGNPDNSPNNKTPRLSSSDNTSSDES